MKQPPADVTGPRGNVSTELIFRFTNWTDRGRAELSKLDVMVSAAAGLASVLWMPFFIVSTLPRNALALGLLPLGLGLLVAGARQRSVASGMALLSCLVIVVAGLVSEAPRVSFVGQMPEWVSVPALVASLGWWAVGREVSSNGRDLVVLTLTGGAMVNGVVGLAQLSLRSESTELIGSPGRASGLMFNPVFYGAFMVGMTALWTAKTSERSSRLRLGLCLALMLMAALSGSRVTLLAAAVSWVCCLTIWRRAALMPVASGVIGVLLADLFARFVGGAQSTVQRLEADGANGRFDIWQYSLRAIRERPLFGWGPANAELAVMPRIRLSFVQEHWSEGAVTIWSDPHNALLMMLLSIGIIGTVTVAGFLVASLRGERSPAVLVGLLAIATTWSLQPLTVHTLPLAMLMLGIAVRERGHEVTRRGVESAGEALDGLGHWNRILLGIGVVITLSMLTAAFVIERAAHRFEPDRAAAAARVFAGDPYLDLFIAEAYDIAFANAGLQPDFLRGSLEYAEHAARVYPTSENYQRVADAAVNVDDIEKARAALERAVEIQMWDPFAHARLHSVAVFTGDEELAERERRTLCLMGEYWCPLASSPPRADLGSTPGTDP